MREEAEKNSEKDKEEKEKIEARNKADNMIYVAEKSLKDAGDKVPADIKGDVEQKIKDLKESLEKGTSQDIEEKTRLLSETLSKIGQNMYGQQGQSTAGPQPEQEDLPKEEPTKTEDKKDVEEGEVVG